MIKLIATDLDGTLLNSKKELPVDFKETLDKMHTNGIAFAVVSGRNYLGVEHIFKEFNHDIYFVCDNGAFIVENGEVVEMCLIPKNVLNNLLHFFINKGNKNIMMCGVNGSYYTKGDDAFVSRMENHYAPTTFVKSLFDVKDDIFKLSVCDLSDDIHTGSYLPTIENFGQEVSAHISAKIWLDIMDKSVDKGVGIKKLQTKLNITKDETMAFGDYYNDIPLLAQATHSFVMENANEDLKASAKNIAPSCDENGVTKIINKLAFK